VPIDPVEVILDILAPRRADSPGRWPIFEWGGEESPTEDEVTELAHRIVTALRGSLLA
jgi:hypothetical protein